jgi:hypothetical protein
LLRGSLQPAVFFGQAGRLDPVAGAALLNGEREVVANGALGDEQGAGDTSDVGAAERLGQRFALRPVSGLSPALSAARARLGSTTRSPATARRMATASSAAGASLTRKPTAPLAIARRR